jgi:hypothetical protein
MDAEQIVDFELAAIMAEYDREMQTAEDPLLAVIMLRDRARAAERLRLVIAAALSADVRDGAQVH